MTDGKEEEVYFDKIKIRIERLSHGLDKKVDPDLVTQQVICRLSDGISTVELDNAAAEVAALMTNLHADYSVLASRIAISNLHKETEKRFSKLIYDLYHDGENDNGEPVTPLISKEVYDIVMGNREVFDSYLDYNRDFEFDYVATRILQKMYLLRMKGRVVERPQHMLMRTSIEIHGRDIPKVLETYSLMSRRFFIHASPTLFNAGTNCPQMSSSFTVSMKDDSMIGIYNTLGTMASISKFSGGVGLNVHNIRSAGTRIVKTRGKSSGIVPMLKVYDETARYADQGGNHRSGAFSIYLELWHDDIFQLLDTQNEGVDEKFRTRSLYIALWVPDHFMNKVKQEADWYLFSPNSVPGLSDAYGVKFEDLYEQYVREGKYRRKVTARTLWQAILNTQIKTGSPSLLYKDACNLKSNQSHLGTIKSSNLCTEIVQYSSPKEVGVSNLASLALPMFVDKNETSIWVDYQALHDVTKIVLRNLDSIIDKTYYPVPEAEVSGKRHRTVAIGVQGLADMYLALRIPFDSQEARETNINIFETIYHGALEASVQLAKDHGPYETYKGSPASEGYLQFDLWNHTPSTLWDWASLKSDIKKYGLRNSLFTALMPTSSTSHILGFNPCFEPYAYNIYKQKLVAGQCEIINQWLLKDLTTLGLWNTEVKNSIISNNGSIQHLSGIPDELKLLYRTVWEIPQRSIIEMAVDRAPFIDQSQSMNLYLKEHTIAKITSMHFFAWASGLKTGVYKLVLGKDTSSSEKSLDTGPKLEVKDMSALKMKTFIPVDRAKGAPKSCILEVDPKTNLAKVLRTSNVQERLCSGPGPVALKRPSDIGLKRISTKLKRDRKRSGAHPDSIENVQNFNGSKKSCPGYDYDVSF